MYWCYLSINLWSIWNLFWFKRWCKDPDSFFPIEFHSCPNSYLPNSPLHFASQPATVQPSDLTLLWILMLFSRLICHFLQHQSTILSLSSDLKRCVLLLMLSTLKISEVLVYLWGRAKKKITVLIPLKMSSCKAHRHRTYRCKTWAVVGKLSSRKLTSMVSKFPLSIWDLVSTWKRTYYCHSICMSPVIPRLSISPKVCGPPPELPMDS